MPYVETLDDIVEDLADRLGVWNAHDDECTEGRSCRVCWVSHMHARLMAAAQNELLLNLRATAALAEKEQG